jgi:hypothetical protein
MSEELVVIEGEVPAYALAQQGAVSNEDALFGLSGGFPPSVSIKSNKFRLKNRDGEETVLKPGDLVDGEYLATVMLKARKPYEKSFYAKAWAEGDNNAPDCFSLDGERPDPSATHKQCETCAACPQNAFGSGRNQAGEPTKGKACSDNKIVAVMIPKHGVFRFKVGPGSLANFGGYVKQLTARNIRLDRVITLVSFDDNTNGVLRFKYGGFVPDSHITKLDDLADSPEVEEIIVPATVAASAPATTQPEPEPAKEEPAKSNVASLFGDEGADAPKEEPKKAETKPAKKAETKAQPKKEEPKVEEAAAPSDDELASLLGI